MCSLMVWLVWCGLVGLDDWLGVWVLKLGHKVCVTKDGFGISPFSVDGLVGGFYIPCVLFMCFLIVWLVLCGWVG